MVEVELLYKLVIDMKFAVYLLALLSVVKWQAVNGDLISWLTTLTSWEALENGLEAQLPQDVTAANATADAIKANTVRFLLYTNKASRFSPDILEYSNPANIQASKFNSSNPVVFFIHGFAHNGQNCSFPQEIKDTYLNLGYNLNIISVDWGSLSGRFDVTFNDPTSIITGLTNYYVAVKNTAIVGQRLGDFIKFLVDIKATTLDKVRVVGFSLGGQVAGYAGQRLIATMKAKIPHITALDPAGPLYQTGVIGRHITKDDATFVDFTHTDMGQSGSPKSLGHVAFFVNGGFPPQPGCIDYYINNTSPLDFFTKIPSSITGSCSHSTAPLYYEQSIPTKIAATKCDNFVAFIGGLCSLKKQATFGDQLDTSMPQGYYYLNLQPMTSSGIYSC